MRGFMYIVGALSFLVAAISVSAAKSDIQIIVAGIFVLIGVVALGFAALIARLDGRAARDVGVS